MRTSVIATELPARRLRLLAAAGAVALMAATLLTGAARAQDGEVSVSTSTADLGTYLVDTADATLYDFAGDQAASDTNGQAVSDVWWVATVDGLLAEG